MHILVAHAIDTIIRNIPQLILKCFQLSFPNFGSCGIRWGKLKVRNTEVVTVVCGNFNTKSREKKYFESPTINTGCPQYRTKRYITEVNRIWISYIERNFINILIKKNDTSEIDDMKYGSANFIRCCSCFNFGGVLLEIVIRGDGWKKLV